MGKSKITILFLLSCQCIILQHLNATPVAPDYLVLNKDTFLLYSTPLEYYFDIKGERFIGEVELKGSGFHDNRGYVATWSIEEGKLYLLSIESGKKQIPLVDEFFEHKIFANWYSGALYSPQGRLIQYNHRPFASVYETDVHYLITDGLINSKKVKENVVFDATRLFPGEQFLKDTITSIIHSNLNHSILSETIKKSQRVLFTFGYDTEGELLGYEVKYPKNEYSVLRNEVLRIAKDQFSTLPPIMKVNHKYYEQMHFEIQIVYPVQKTLKR